MQERKWKFIYGRVYKILSEYLEECESKREKEENKKLSWLEGANTFLIGGCIKKNTRKKSINLMKFCSFYNRFVIAKLNGSRRKTEKKR